MFPCDDTVKPVLSDHPKIDKTKMLMTNGSSMKVESYDTETCLKRPLKIDKTTILMTNGSLMNVKSIDTKRPLKNRQNKDLNDKW